jgi:hypothetical protein
VDVAAFHLLRRDVSCAMHQLQRYDFNTVSGPRNADRLPAAAEPSETVLSWCDDFDDEMVSPGQFRVMNCTGLIRDEGRWSVS